MRHLYNILFVSVFLIFLACSPTKEAAKNSVSNVPTKDKMRNSSLFIDAIKEKNQGNFEKAIKLFEEAIQLDPNDAASLYELAGLYMNNNRNEEAEKLAIKAVNLKPENDWYKVMLSNAYKLNAKIAESNAVLEKLVAKNPNNLEYIQELIFGYVMAEEYEKTIQTIELIEKKTGLSEQIAMQKQQLYLKLNKVDEAIGEIEKLVNLYPYETRYYAILAELCLNHDKDEKALMAYQKIAELEPDNAYIHISLFDYYRKKDDRKKAVEELKLGLMNKNLDVESKLQFMMSFYENTEFYSTYKDETKELLQIMMEVHPEHLQTKAIYADLIMRNEQHEEAAVIVEELLKMDSSQYAYWELSLMIEWAKEDFQTLITKANIVSDQFPMQFMPYYLIGIAEYRLENYEESLTALIRGQKLAIGNTNMLINFYSQIGETQRQLNNFQEAYDAYDNVLKLDESNSVVLNNYAYYLSIDNKDLDKALEMANKAVELDPYNASNLDTKAWVLFKQEKYVEAKEWIEKAIKLDESDNAELLEHYGDILYKLNEIDEAVKMWERAKATGEGSDELDEKIKARKIND
ncbi:MAG: hypothetical protein CL663_07315 [Bacteroidetes bacterium]|nr:hypothetical protein [Bacteroidota bacterium]